MGHIQVQAHQVPAQEENQGGILMVRSCVLHLVAVALVGLALPGCSRSPAGEEVLHHYPVDDLDGILTRDGFTIDQDVTSDGNGSLRIQVEGPRIVRLYDLENVDVEDARLVYRVKLRTEDVDGPVFLEMWCRFPGLGEFFSRALQSPVSGTTEWTSQETAFFLRQGQNPDLIKLNLVLGGAGTVWIDDIVVSKTPL